MMLSLICTMMAAVLFQPALMGPPRDKAREPETRTTRQTSPAFAQAFRTMPIKGPGGGTIPDQSP